MGIKSDISENTDNKRSTDKNINKYLVKVEEPGTLLNMRPGVWLILGTEKNKNENTNDDLTEEKKPNKLYAKEPEVWCIKWIENETAQEPTQGPEQEPIQEPECPQYICLQVAETKDIWNEMKKDWEMLYKKQIPKPESETKKWVNQFGEFQFMYSAKGLSRKWLYQHIAEKYKNIKFVCVAYGNDDNQSDSFQSMNDEKNRFALEKYVAYSTFARFWRNGGSFRNERPLRGEKSARTGKVKQGEEGIEDIKEADVAWCNNNKTTIANILVNDKTTKNNKLEILDCFLKIIRVYGVKKSSSSKT